MSIVAARRTRSTADALIASIAAAQGGVAAPEPSALGRMWAAVLAGGDGAWLSHDSAASRLEWLGRGGIRHVSRVGRGKRLPGLELHGCRPPLRGEVIEVGGVRCSSPARALVEVASRQPQRIVERCLDQWERQGGIDAGAVLAAARRGRPGSAIARSLLFEHSAGTTVTRSEFEERFIPFLRRRRFAGWTLNEPMTLPSGTPIVVDVWWPRERVALELDSRSEHARQMAFESDHARDLELLAMGVKPGRVTWRKLHRDPNWVDRNLRMLLDSGSRGYERNTERPG